ncbi:restriction endonuclease [Enterococcus sp. 5B3_DIV0040]|uniref:restriction endonuclease n=1 Tax=Enterococcus sp. 5B3_DIV0040 TaxID=1834182 RepID=UPI000B64E20B|nr:restriction endonuclease [Enterococcus sp. 5B3_DIV0040]OTO01348.1 hypothetical protein A5883_003666 [Enterococcus sp. 5B3_DIV0040]
MFVFSEDTCIDENMIKITGADIEENFIREKMPDVLDILLVDRTKSTQRKQKNIIWGHNQYSHYDKKAYSAESEIFANLITGNMKDLIMPRALKTDLEKQERTKSKAEVFTPLWTIKKQNDYLEKDFLDLNLEQYVQKTWLEITCGEGPYMVSRYDVEKGYLVPIKDRQGFVDRKLKRINLEVDNKAEWQRLVEEAYKASYGYEWNGDSLLIARENMLYTYRDYYISKWNEEPILGLFKKIATIISYNVFQMDGLKFIVPFSEKKEKAINIQLSLFDIEPEEQWIIKKGKK